MSHYAGLIAEATERDMATWPVGRPFPLRPRMQAITLDVIVQAVFGTQSPQMSAVLGQFLRACGSLLILNPAWRKDLGRHSPWGRFVRLRARVHRMVEKEIAERRRAADLSWRTDMLSVLLCGNKGLDDDGLRDELITMLLAGHDTTASALAWAFDLLVHHPEVHKRLVVAVGDGDDDYLDAVVKEAMRLRPVIAEAGRTLTGPTNIGGYRLPAGVSVTPSILLLQRRPDLYPDPLAFRPERFLGATDPHTWTPFGGGIRRCLGAPFATLEIHVVLRTVLRRMRLAPASRRPARPKRRAVTLMPGDGTRVVAIPTEDASGALA
jgi:cytochrome P450